MLALVGFVEGAVIAKMVVPVNRVPESACVRAVTPENFAKLILTNVKEK